jgi:hypothetical protein
MTKLWEEWDETTAKAEVETARKSAGFSKWLPKFAIGKNVVRILPARVGCTSPFRVTYIHYIDLPGSKVSFVCPMQEASQPCPVCTTIARLQVSENPLDKDRAKRMNAQYTVYANVYSVLPEAAQPRAQIARFTQKVHKTILSYKTDFGVPFDHPVRGTNIVLVREGSTQTDTKYTLMLDPMGASKLSNDDQVMTQILQSMWNLDNEVMVPTFDQVQRMLRGEKVDLYKERGSMPAVSGGSRAVKAIAATTNHISDDDLLDG